ncbi:MAG: hypothetical protein GC134_09155 [Proteobacteria bacterium]|nr:hypothetical protein [Pseudomonadota bacterium]
MGTLLFLIELAAAGFVLWLLWHIAKRTLRVFYHAVFPPRPDLVCDGFYYDMRVRPFANGGSEIIIHREDSDEPDCRLVLMPDYDVPLEPNLWEESPWPWSDEEVPAQMKPLPSYVLGAGEIEVPYPPHLYVDHVSVTVYDESQPRFARVHYRVVFKRKPTLLPQAGYDKVSANGEF